MFDSNFFKAVNSRLLEVADSLLNKLNGMLPPGTYTAKDMSKETKKIFSAIQKSKEDQNTSVLYKMNDSFGEENVTWLDIFEVEFNGDKLLFPYYDIFTFYSRFEICCKVKVKERHKWEIKPKGKLVGQGHGIGGNPKTMKKLGTYIRLTYPDSTKLDIQKGVFFAPYEKSEGSYLLQFNFGEFSSSFEKPLNPLWILPGNTIKKLYGKIRFEIYEREIKNDSKTDIFHEIVFINSDDDKFSLVDQSIHKKIYRYRVKPANPIPLKPKKNDIPKETMSIIIGEKECSLPVKYATQRGKLLLQIPSPTIRNNVAPTLMASGYANASYKNMYSSGHFPKMGVLEIWEIDEDPKNPCPEDLKFNSKEEALASPFIRQDKKGKMFIVKNIPNHQDIIQDYIKSCKAKITQNILEF